MKSQILLVDNDEVLGGFYQELLQEIGDVHFAKSANQAILLLQKQDFDVIISDYLMEDGDGILLAKHVHEIPDSAPLILLSGFASKEIAILSVELGVFAFLEKTCTPDELLEMVKEAISFKKRKSLEQNFKSMGEITSILLHELVDPINRSLSRLELMETKYTSDKQITLSRIDEIKEDLNYLSNIINRVRDQILGCKNLHFKSYSVKHFLEVIEKLQPDFMMNFNESLKTIEHKQIKVDIIMFNHVLDNLRKNALESFEGQNPNSLEMKLTASSLNDGFLELCFENNSTLISEDIRDRVFEPFFSMKKNHKGNLGIGLFFCLKIIKNHKGQIQLLPREKTTFQIKMPLV